jgi:glucosyl-3-phosphoglycerate synthase
VRIALLIPALNEASSMPRTARVAREALDAGLVSSATVLDGGSSDGTADAARAAGVEVLHIPSVMPELGPVLGKGDSLFRGVHAVPADWYVFLDADIGNAALSHVAALVAPVAGAGLDGPVFVKGGFVRVDEQGRPREVPAGRVGEQTARPLLGLVAPRLAALRQPLSGQVAVRGDVARGLPFVTGYGVEIAMLIDIWRMHGAPGIVEADMGEVQNRSKPDDDLDDVTADVIAAAAMRGVGEGVPPGVRLSERRRG